MSESGKPQEKCGIVGIIDLSGKEVVKRAIQMLNSLQHRGDDACGILTIKYGLHRFRRLGFVSQIFTESFIKINEIEGSLAIGHTRYLNQGQNTIEYSQPIIAKKNESIIGLAHNGNIPNLNRLKEKACKTEPIKPEYDSNLIAHAIVCAEREGWIEKIQDAMLGVEGSYSLVLATHDEHLIAVRDPWANRPLSLAKIPSGFVFASETVAFPVIKASGWYELEPGEIIDISRKGIFKSSLLEETGGGRCVFEKIYLSHETSVIDGETVEKFRARMGNLLAKKHPGGGDVVSAVPESANAAARSYAYSSGKPLEGLILKKRLSIKRSFMQGEMGKRKQIIEAKFDLSPDAEGKKIDLIEDSVVVGNTLRILNLSLRGVGALETHIRPTAPKLIDDCPWGTNFRSEDGEFIAKDKDGRTRTNEEIAKDLGVSSVDYPTLDELKEVVNQGKAGAENHCFKCMGGEGLRKAVIKNERPKVEPFIFLS